MSRTPTLRKADLDRVLKALADKGLGVASVVVRPGGEVVITPTALTGQGPPVHVSALDSYRERKRGAGAA
jgi:hypothetical protein